MEINLWRFVNLPKYLEYMSLFKQALCCLLAHKRDTLRHLWQEIIKIQYDGNMLRIKNSMPRFLKMVLPCFWSSYSLHHLQPTENSSHYALQGISITYGANRFKSKPNTILAKVGRAFKSSNNNIKQL